MESIAGRPLGRIEDALRPMNRFELVAFCREFGVGPRQARLILQNKKADAQSVLRLCSVLGIDPITARSVPPRTRLGFNFSFGHFGAVLAFSRSRQRLSIRDAAILAGVSIATLSRAESGRPIAFTSLVLICPSHRRRLTLAADRSWPPHRYR